MLKGQKDLKKQPNATSLTPRKIRASKTQNKQERRNENKYQN
jgi:hypothetical protein